MTILVSCYQFSKDIHFSDMIGVWFEPESVAWERERSELIRLDCILTKEQKNHGQNKTKNNLIC